METDKKQLQLKGQHLNKIIGFLIFIAFGCNQSNTKMIKPLVDNSNIFELLKDSFDNTSVNITYSEIQNELNSISFQNNKESIRFYEKESGLSNYLRVYEISISNSNIQYTIVNIDKNTVDNNFSILSTSKIISNNDTLFQFYKKIKENIIFNSLNKCDYLERISGSNETFISYKNNDEKYLIYRPALFGFDAETETPYIKESVVLGKDIISAVETEIIEKYDSCLKSF